MANPWFRMYSEFVNDPKVQRLSETNQRRYIMLLCVRCSNGDVTLHDEDVTFSLRISDSEWAETKAVLIERGLIGNDNKPSAWEKRQFSTDSSTPRVARHRAKAKEASNGDVTLQKQKSNALEQNRTDTDTEDKSNVGEKTADACPSQKIIELFNEHLPMLPSVKILTDTRRRLLKTRWSEDKSRQSLDWWERFFKYVSSLPFLTGENDRGWQADIDFILTTKNFVKIIEGGHERRAA